MTPQYETSQIGLTSGVSATSIGGLGDKQMCRLSYSIDVYDPGVAGILVAKFRWKNRQGVTRQKQSLNVSIVGGLLMPMHDDGVICFQSEDASGAGAFFEWEIVPISVVGSYAYDFWAHIEGTPGN